ncbi:hypothetical protein LAZ67_6001583 [Cordylochernes scorpioides]|uniref:Uncharacterized protein n=1 Tax=Cordylochernes scorpioides TaxID=51811 RepID=A0ABY6KJA7_9ARAC|nr:hypothetical protein LAZ67_6001583 [Cordylochernes scorpioides]
MDSKIGRDVITKSLSKICLKAMKLWVQILELRFTTCIVTRTNSLIIAYSDEQGERFHQDIEVIGERYQGV